MKNRTGKALLKIVFAIFAVCMAISAIAFNLEKLQLSLIFFRNCKCTRSHHDQIKWKNR